jgi:hypothetical protein
MGIRPYSFLAARGSKLKEDAVLSLRALVARTSGQLLECYFPERPPGPPFPARKLQSKLIEPRGHLLALAFLTHAGGRWPAAHPIFHAIPANTIPASALKNRITLESIEGSTILRASPHSAYPATPPMMAITIGCPFGRFMVLR